MHSRGLLLSLTIVLLGVLVGIHPLGAQEAPFLSESVVQNTISDLLTRHGDGQKVRIERGVRQTAAMWRQNDGSPEAFNSFCQENFIADAALLDATFTRFETNMEILNGHLLEIGRALSTPLQLEIGAVLPVDYLFANYDASAHVMEDLYINKIAFTALLNFPAYTLAERLELGNQWSRAEWAQMRLARTFITERVPAVVSQALKKAYVGADDYISNYNIYMHCLLDDKGQRLFPAGLKLITHWGLRDELKAQYPQQGGLQRQRMIQKVMERIITQEIPQQVIDNDQVVWAPYSNRIMLAGNAVAAPREADERYRHLKDVFAAESAADPYYPLLPSKLVRRFERDREIPEKEFEAILVRMLTDPVAKDVARLISKRLNRKLEPFDIWYNGFKPRSVYVESELDKIIGEKYPDTAAFQADLPHILTALGFDNQTAAFLSSKITVDPSRGAGHAMGAARRADNAHLRTRIPEGGMKYKGYNIAIHELGHCVEQVFSLNRIDHTLLAGVPNTAFTEAFAFVFQHRDLELLGLKQEDSLADDLRALDTYWSTCEIAAVGLVDMRVWHWMYDHPAATPAELREAVILIARQVWNEYFAPVFGIKDVTLLAIYSHMIDAGLYLPDYSLGHIINFQIERYLQGKNLGAEMERMCKLGLVTPEAWMSAAVGNSISAEPLLQAAKEAVQRVKS